MNKIRINPDNQPSMPAKRFSVPNFYCTKFFSTITISLILCTMISCKNKAPEIVIIPDHEKNHLQKSHLFGNIKEIHTTSYYQSDSTADLRTLSSVIQYYSPDGFLLKVVTANENEEVVSTQKIFYHKNAKEDYWIISDAHGITTDSCQYVYDMNGFIAEEKRWNGDSLFLSITYKTDGAGNIIESKRNNNTFTLTHTIAYNAHGLASKIEEFEPSGKLFKYITLEYDNYGDEVNRRVCKRGGDLLEYTYTQYNDKGHLLKVIYENNTHQFRETYTYAPHDAHGNWLTEKRENIDHSLYMRKREIIYY